MQDFWQRNSDTELWQLTLSVGQEGGKGVCIGWHLEFCLHDWMMFPLASGKGYDFLSPVSSFLWQSPVPMSQKVLVLGELSWRRKGEKFAQKTEL